MSVVALGAMCEIEDLSAPRRSSILDGQGYTRYSIPSEINAPKSSRKWYMLLHQKSSYTVVPNDVVFAEQREAFESGKTHFYVEEFADLTDGRRVILRDDRGWSSWPVNSPNSQWKTAIGRELTKMTILVLDPNDNENWMEWVIERLHFLGIAVDPISVHAAPFQVEFGPRVRNELRQYSSRLRQT
ncbi:hypothetical protein [Candidatus Poriferisocius sp.]|uniref:hypothetical protein n=1 Tax=Candidatus Poriferisocius sp. TaxID=3101276 RepID=UPI003B599375